MVYYTRVLEPQLKNFLESFPVIGITGPRQSGKSTLLKHCMVNHYRYVTFDDQEMVSDFVHDPKRFMRQFSNDVIFDEVQKVPEIFNYIKLAVDEDRERLGKFILTGSSQFSMLTRITESLAGRIGLLTLLPLQYAEIPKHLRSDAIYKGSYPEIVKRSYTNSWIWYGSYISTYLEKDVRQISQIGDMRDFSRFIQLLAANTAQSLNLTRFANDIGVSVPTVKRWISVLEASYIIFLLPPFYQNLGKRIVKSPKVYFYDTGLVAYLTQITDQALFEKGPMAGSLFENYVIAEIKKKLFHTNDSAKMYYYRTSHGVEVDLLIDRGLYKEWVEVKFNETFKPIMLSPMKSLMAEQDKGILLYTGTTREYDPNILISNFGDYLQTSAR